MKWLLFCIILQMNLFNIESNTESLSIADADCRNDDECAEGSTTRKAKSKGFLSSAAMCATGVLNGISVMGSTISMFISIGVVGADVFRIFQKSDYDFAKEIALITRLEMEVTKWPERPMPQDPLGALIKRNYSFIVVFLVIINILLAGIFLALRFGEVEKKKRRKKTKINK